MVRRVLGKGEGESRGSGDICPFQRRGLGRVTSAANQARRRGLTRSGTSLGSPAARHTFHEQSEREPQTTNATMSPSLDCSTVPPTCELTGLLGRVIDMIQSGLGIHSCPYNDEKRNCWKLLFSGIAAHGGKRRLPCSDQRKSDQKARSQ
ncbi:hypothetical protein LZ30DRAFT_725711 [Colletotrichum cereale]|nr:hypothetical protein LZ30DRAFT_725711 [Colletotrichum cereale]